MKKLLFLFIVLSVFSCNSGKEKSTTNAPQISNTVEATINIGGLHCANCVASVEKGINSLDGINAVAVSLEDSTAVVKYDTNQVAIDDIKISIEKRGYTVKSVK